MELKCDNKILKLMKAYTSPQYKYSTVLTNSSFEYVELWLRGQKEQKYKEALFYWKQAKNFYDVSTDLPIYSKPLTAYYCILNATKALLAIDGVNLTNIGHGVASARSALKGNIRQDKITYSGGGVLCELSRHIGDAVVKTDYTLFDLLYNLPCIHRTFTITYNYMPELFVPIKNVSYVLTNHADVTKRKAFIRFDVDKRYDNPHVRRYINRKIEHVTLSTGEMYYRCKDSFSWNKHQDLATRMLALNAYHKKTRRLFYYINGSSILWYLKKDGLTGEHLIDRHSLTIIYGVMHWLSELVRYNPKIFYNMLNTKQNWLIREFINVGLPQFIDEISSEITGANIMCPGYRS